MLSVSLSSYEGSYLSLFAIVWILLPLMLMKSEFRRFEEQNCELGRISEVVSYVVSLLLVFI